MPSTLTATSRGGSCTRPEYIHVVGHVINHVTANRAGARPAPTELKIIFGWNYPAKHCTFTVPIDIETNES